jgi:hypothetical protein
MKIKSKHIFPTLQVITLLKDRDTRLWIGKKLFMLILPFIVVLTLLYSIILVGCFIAWTLPVRWYFPFITGGDIQAMFDRTFLLIGVMLMFYVSE